MNDTKIPDELINDEFGSLDSLKITDDDILILKGKFSLDELQAFVAALKHRRKNNIIICLPNETTLETMTEEMFLDIAEKIKEKRKNETA